MKQLGIAAQTHLSINKRLPTNGWSAQWLGVPERGTGRGQPGGWIFNLLQYMEEKQIWMMQYGLGDAAQDCRQTNDRDAYTEHELSFAAARGSDAV